MFDVTDVVVEESMEYVVRVVEEVVGSDVVAIDQGSIAVGQVISR